MRIIDKNTDFYDYISNVYRDDSLTFDRTDSFVVTKDVVCDHLTRRRRLGGRRMITYSDNHDLILLQIGNTFWLFLVEITEYDKWDKAVDYQIELLKSWKNYDKSRVLIAFDVINMGHGFYDLLIRHSWDDIPINRVDEMVKSIDTNDYKVKSSINKFYIYRDHLQYDEVKRVPLLKACGIANIVDPLDIYLAFEEYFSLEKTASERRDPVGTTDVDRLESHGFDRKTSFRGKR